MKPKTASFNMFKHFSLTPIILLTFYFLLHAPLCVGSEEVSVFSQPSENKLISPLIYGLARDREPRREENVWQLNPTYFRFGGNTSSRFNWKTNSWNTGKDWYFANFTSNDSNMIDVFMNENVNHFVASSITLPLLGWVAKDSQSASFPVDVFKNQQQIQKSAGNGIGKDGQILSTDPRRCCVPFGPVDLGEWVRHLKTRFGKFEHHYILGNEPMLWWSTHRDVHPEPVSYDEIYEKFKTAAIAVRKADPEAVIIGPALWGWLAMNYSSLDEKSKWNNWKKNTDRKKHGDIPFLDWFLQKIVADEKKLGISLLDILDVHYYPEGKLLRSGNVSSEDNRKLRIKSTRSLWDRSYTDQSWIDEKIYLIPRLKEIAHKFKPSLRVGIGEYNFRAENDIVGGIVQAEVLGIFGRYELDSANYWTIPPQGTPPFYAFKMYRNYDGLGSAFQNHLLQNSYGIKDDASVFASCNENKTTATVIVINKKMEQNLDISINITKIIPKPTSIKVFRYGEKEKSKIVMSSLKAESKIDLSITPLSISLIEIKK